MMKTLLTTTVFATMLLVAAPTFAQAQDCAAMMKSNDTLIIKATDSAKKTAAQKHMVLAKQKMDAKDENGCLMASKDAAMALQ